MRPQDKILVKHFQTLGNINEQERQELLEGLMANNAWSLRRLSKEIEIPLTTIHGWINFDTKEKSKENHQKIKAMISNLKVTTIRDIGDQNKLLNTILNSLKSIKQIESDFGENILEAIKQQVERLGES